MAQSNSPQIRAQSPFPVCGLSRQEQCRAFFEQLGTTEQLRYAGSKYAGTVRPGKAIAEYPPEPILLIVVRNGESPEDARNKLKQTIQANSVYSRQSWNFGDYDAEEILEYCRDYAADPRARYVVVDTLLAVGAQHSGLSAALGKILKTVDVKVDNECTQGEEMKTVEVELASAPIVEKSYLIKVTAVPIKEQTVTMKLSHAPDEERTVAAKFWSVPVKETTVTMRVTGVKDEA